MEGWVVSQPYYNTQTDSDIVPCRTLHDHTAGLVIKSLIRYSYSILCVCVCFPRASGRSGCPVPSQPLCASQLPGALPCQALTACPSRPGLCPWIKLVPWSGQAQCRVGSYWRRTAVVTAAVAAAAVAEHQRAKEPTDRTHTHTHTDNLPIQGIGRECDIP